MASRIAPLPGSKELFPLGFRLDAASGTFRPKVVSHYLLERMQLAGVERVYMVLRNGKWDIPAYYGDGSLVGMPIAYLLMKRPYGAPYSLDQAYPFVQDATIVLGYPDILIEPPDAYARVLHHLEASGADVALGLFTTDQPHKTDMVEVDEAGYIRRIEVKPQQTSLAHTWMFAVWTPTFTHFMHQFLAQDEAERLAGTAKRELYVGDVIQAGIESGLRVQSHFFPNGFCLDIGTPDQLVEAMRRYGLPEG